MHISTENFKFANRKFHFINLQMDIVTRLKQFLKQNNIAITQFADNCQIPRPTLSQLLNGRNKKVSDEVIAKIHHTYPSLNIMWLMFGDGDMFVPNANLDDIPTAQRAESDENEINLDYASGKSNSQRQQSISFDDDDRQFSSNTPKGRVSSGGSSSSLVDMMMTLQNVMGGNHQSSPARNSKGDKRRVVNIIVYYNDQSFDVFGPN